MTHSLIWYASYGSNILYERFLCYIKGGTFYANNVNYKGCSDQTPLSASKAVIIPYEVYYGNESPSWGGTGVAFLDTSKKGVSLGRMYLITDAQFEEVWKQEGRSPKWYCDIVDLGEHEGCPIKTFTNNIRRSENPPSEKYLEVVRKGYAEIIPGLVYYQGAVSREQ